MSVEARRSQPQPPIEMNGLLASQILLLPYMCKVETELMGWLWQNRSHGPTKYRVEYEGNITSH